MPVYDLGDYRLDSDAQIVEYKGEILPLRPKLIVTLVALAEGAPGVVPKERLIERVWPDTCVVEGVLTRNISELRAELAKGFGDQRVIETIPKRGYRLAVCVARTPVSEPPEARTARTAAALRLPLLVLALAAAVVAAGLAGWVLSREGAPGSPAPFSAGTVDPDVDRNRAMADFRLAYDYYDHWSLNQMNAAINSFYSTTELMPGGWHGYMGLAQANIAERLLSGRGFGAKRDLVMRSAARSLELGPEIAATHSTLGAALLIVEWDLPGASEAIERAIQWNPRSPAPYMRRGQLRVFQGRFEEARTDFAKAIDLRSDYDDCRLSWAWADFCARDFALAVERVRDILPHTNKQEQAHRLLAAAHGANGDFEQARAALAKAWLPDADRLHFEAWLAAREGKQQEAALLLDQLRARCRRERLEFCDVSLAATALGRYNDAFESLAQGLAVRHWKILFASVDPRLEDLHSDPRWAELMDSIKPRHH